MPRKKKSCQDVAHFPSGSKCAICLTSKEKDTQLGSIYKTGNTFAHYFCLLLSNGIKQSGKDNQGILGFLMTDIAEEANRGKTVKCSYCGENGATIICALKSCPIKFHLPCGSKKGSMHLFFDTFPSFCVKHRKVQELPMEEKEKYKEAKPDCPVCAKEIDIEKITKFIWPSCCKSIPSHRKCIQKYAFTAGSHHFQCLLCRDKDSYPKLCQSLGIFIPERDALWELEPRAFEELRQQRYCNAEKCLNIRGRHYFDERTKKWRHIKCILCSTGTHWGCHPYEIDDIDAWVCLICESVSDSFKDENTSSHQSNIPISIKKPRQPLPSHSLVKISCNKNQPSTSGSSSNSLSEKVPRIVLTKFDLQAASNFPQSFRTPDSPSSSDEGAQEECNTPCNYLDLADENSTQNATLLIASVVSLADSDPMATTSADEVPLLNETTSADEIPLANEVPLADEIIMIDDDDDDDPAPTQPAQSSLGSSSLGNGHESLLHVPVQNSEERLENKPDINEAIVLISSDDDVEFVGQSHQRPKKKIFKSQRRKSCGSDDDCILIGESSPVKEATISNKVEGTTQGSNERSSLTTEKSASTRKSLESDGTKKSTSLQQSNAPGKESEESKINQSLAKPLASIRPFTNDEKNVEKEPLPPFKRTKFDLPSTSESFRSSSSKFNSLSRSSLEMKQTITAYFDDSKPGDEFNYKLTTPMAKIFSDYMNLFVWGDSVTVIYDKQGKKYCQLFTQYYDTMLPIIVEETSTFDSKLFQRLRRYESRISDPYTVFLIASDVSNTSEDFLELVESFLEGSIYTKLVLTTLPEITSTSIFNFKVRLSKSFNRSLFELCFKYRSRLDIWDLSKVEIINCNSK